MKSTLTFSWLAVPILLCLGACSGQLSQQSQNSIERIEPRQSPNDDRAYRYLRLPNQMQVLLVSDPETDKSAAALAVYRGSFHETNDRPGLAHFLEHMLFIGTRKYPEVDTFQQFITGNGGSSNAYTALDHTNYFFDIQNSGFPEGLDRFAHFFIDPLLSPEYVEREKNAVHSEYQMQIKDDGWRGYSVSKRALNPEHPGHRFTIGSLDTLAGDVGDDLQQFFEKHYSADQMGLAILSDRSLDDLEALVRPLFGQVVNKDAGPLYPSVPMFAEGQLPARLDSASIKDSFQITYNFPVPSVLPNFQNKPQEYIGNLLGHEGSGGLHRALIQRGWIESLNAGTDNFDHNTSMISVGMKLTPEGRENIPSISALLFDYIALLRAEEPKRWLYEEQAKVAELAFRFQGQGSATGFVYRMAPRLAEYPPEQLLVAPYLMENFDAQMIKDYLGYLRQDNVFIEVSAPDVATDAVETWFKVPYRLTQGAIELAPVEAFLALPEPNPFLPEALGLLTADEQPITLAVDTGAIQLWLDTDVEFGAPRANMRIDLVSEQGSVTPADRAQNQLFIKLINDALSESLYPASLAGMGYGLQSTSNGMRLKLSGYQDKQLILLKQIVHQLINAPLTQERFEILKTALIMDWRNAAKDKPYSQALRKLGTRLVDVRFTPNELADALESVDLSALSAWRKNQLRTLSVFGGLHGNVQQQDAEAVAAYLQDALPLRDMPRRQPTVQQLSEAESINLDVDHDDAVLLLYVQDPDDSFASAAKSGLAGQLLRSPFFSSLRTDQQLGYVVSAGVRRLSTQSGNIFLVQSPAAGVEDLREAVMAFMESYINDWETLSDEDFQRQKEGLITRLTEKDKNLTERSEDYWESLDVENYLFNSKEQVAKQVASLDKAEMGAFMKDIYSRLQTRSLTIFSPGKFDQRL